MRENRLGKEITIILIAAFIILTLISVFAKPKTTEQNISYCWERYGENWQECFENFDKVWADRWKTDD